MRKLKPLTARESAQLGAALLLLKRGDVQLARKVLFMQDRVNLVRELDAYIKAHTRYQKENREKI